MGIAVSLQLLIQSPIFSDGDGGRDRDDARGRDGGRGRGDDARDEMPVQLLAGD